MVIPKIAAVLLLGVASIASAEPKEEGAIERHRYGQKQRPTVPIGEWFVLATATPAKHGREFITVDSARLGKLRLAAIGRVEVWTVRVNFKDGTHQHIQLNRMIKPGRPALVEINGTKPIVLIVITTERAGKGAYTVEAVAAGKPSVGV